MIEKQKVEAIIEKREERALNDYLEENYSQSKTDKNKMPLTELLEK